ncbi:restriction endonuclease subunit S [Listeria monocytogenes]|nr:restriction endonuclease subunit S [Listeria monocytogenes]EIB7707671.1 restriction endonuclease subunit S [Listeria monocytogenes]EIB7756437.1 restriction endonuclease subunit S [Listeria monocytogenes]EIB7769655.1 restriction endonuclease subunit S [Listeria monocytogenes]EIB7778467.1 restriction endonuclease subunit S [Listeria monocytogenes]
MLPLFYVISHYSNLPFRAWEQRKLGDLVVDYVEKTSVQNQFPMLTSSQQKGIVLQEGYFANRQVTTENNIGYFVLPRGYFTFRSRSDNDVFVFNRNDIIDRGIISYFYPVFTLKSADSDFFLRRINNGIQRQLSIQAEGTGQHVLSLKKFKNIVAMFPSEGEQKKIGSFFKQLDDTIALHQRKLDTLKQMKKGFLQQMFPNNDEEIPNMRFTDFYGIWEQRKLKSITEKITRKNKELESTLPLTISAQDGLIDQNEYFNKIIASRNIRGYFLVKNGEFAYNKSYSKGYPWGVVKRLDNYNMGVLSTLYIIFKPVKINSDFLTKYFDSTYWYRAVSQFATEGARNHGLLNIAASDFFEIELNIPLNNEEQKKIGLFFQQLENIIILHQNKLEKLSILKKTYLKKMFI